MRRPSASPSPEPDTSPAGPTGGKRRYETPLLVEYGSVGKLTQGGSGAYAELTTMKKTMCL